MNLLHILRRENTYVFKEDTEILREQGTPTNCLTKAKKIYIINSTIRDIKHRVKEEYKKGYIYYTLNDYRTEIIDILKQHGYKVKQTLIYSLVVIEW